jgi:Leucine-rich repeat (LRR) protein
LDVSDNTALTYLNCSSNQLTSLDVSNNPALTYLYCQNNPLTSLDVSQNTALINLSCGDNLLTSLNVSGATALTYLNCSSNQLTSLDVSNNPALTYLHCQNNPLTNLDLRNGNNTNMTYFNSTNNPNLTCISVDWLLVFSNQVNIDIDGWSLLSLDCASGMTYIPDDNFEQALIDFGYDNLLDDSVLTGTCNGVVSLNLDSYGISDLTGIEDFIALTNLVCSNSLLTSLDVSNNLLLEDLDCHNNSIECIDISNNTSLTNLDCSNNLLERLNLKNGNFLSMYVDAVGNNLMCIEVDNIGYATNNWSFDSFSTVNTNCNYTNACNMTYGCTDSLAINYDPTATIDDGSCVYCTTLSANVSVTNPSCNGFSDGSVQVTASGGTGPYMYDLYIDSPPNFWASNNTGWFTGIGVQIWTVYVIDANGCMIVVPLQIVDPTPLTANISVTNVSCNGGNDGTATVSVTGGTPPYSYYWTPMGATTQTITGLGAGAYIVNITDANNCVNSETVVISEPLPLALNNTINGCDSVLIGSNYYTISGAYTDTLTSVNGCDSVVNTNLTIGQNTSSYDTLSVGASIVWNGLPLSISGDYSVTLINSAGCDSITNLNLTISTTPTWDCVNNACIDPGTGLGAYSTVAACNTACVVVTPSWDCVNNACIDPGTGAGMYPTQAACTAVCGVSAIQEHSTNKELLKVTDLLGRETKGTKNEVLFYIYDDGTVEKRIVIE